MSYLIPYLGGKTRLAKTIISRMPAHTCYVEVFAGGAAVFFQKPPVETEVLNDRDSDLVNMYRCLKNHPEELYRQFKFQLVSRAEFERQKQIPPETLTDVQRAARYLYLQRLCYSGRLTSGRSYGTHTQGESHLNILTLQNVLEQAWMRLAGVQIECLDFRELIPRYDRDYTLFYLDPPYWGMPYYAHNFAEQDFVDLSRILTGIRGNFLLSINDTPEIREIFSQFRIDAVQLTYSVNAKNAEDPGEAHTELIVSNCDPAHQQPLLF